MAGRYKSLKTCKESGCNKRCMPNRNLCRQHHNIKQREIWQRNKHKYKNKKDREHKSYYRFLFG